jgi:thiol-disulfide isomerase/thioredoxin
MIVLRLLIGMWVLLTSPISSATEVDSLFSASFIDPSGKPVELSSYRGKPLIVNFWARWCGPCRKEIPQLTKIQDSYREKGIVVLGIALEEADAREAVADFAKAYDVNYPIVLGDNRKTLWLMQILGNSRGGLPFTVVIDAKGKLLSRKLGEITASELTEAAKSLLR